MIEGTVHTALTGFVAGRCYASRFPQAPDIPVWPSIRYTVIDSQSEGTICGTDLVDTDDMRVQLDVVAKTHGAMLTLRDQVIAAFAALTPPPDRVGNFQTYDEETKTHRAVLDYLFQQSSS